MKKVRIYDEKVKMYNGNVLMDSMLIMGYCLTLFIEFVVLYKLCIDDLVINKGYERELLTNLKLLGICAAGVLLIHIVYNKVFLWFSTLNHERVTKWMNILKSLTLTAIVFEAFVITIIKITGNVDYGVGGATIAGVVWFTSILALSCSKEDTAIEEAAAKRRMLSQDDDNENEENGNGNGNNENGD